MCMILKLCILVSVITSLLFLKVPSCALLLIHSCSPAGLQSGRTILKFLITSLAIRCLIIRKWSNEHFSAITEKSNLNPRVLFSTLNSVVNPPVSDSHDVSLQTCKHFLKHFIEKIATEED